MVFINGAQWHLCGYVNPLRCLFIFLWRNELSCPRCQLCSQFPTTVPGGAELLYEQLSQAVWWTEFAKNRNYRTHQKTELSDSRGTGTVGLHRNRNCQAPQEPELSDSRKTGTELSDSRETGLHRNRNCRTPQEPGLSDSTTFLINSLLVFHFPVYLELITNRIEQTAFCNQIFYAFYQAQEDFSAT